MNTSIKRRYVGVCVLVLLLFLAMVLKLADLQLIQGQAYSERSENSKTREIVLKGERGRILDANGIPLAYDQKSYDVVFYRDRTKRDNNAVRQYTQIIRDTIRMVESNGDKVVANFAIQKNAAGEFEFYWGVEDPAVAEVRENNWRKNMQLSKDFINETPDVIYWHLRNQRYYIPEDASDEEALKILGIWQEVQLTSYIAYLPVTVAKNVSTKTVAQIEARSADLQGMQITEGTTRVYPKRDVAAHVLGYTSRISESELIRLSNKKYAREDMIGVSGIEQTYEEYLTGSTLDHQGKRVVEINNLGVITRELSMDKPTNGNDVILTLDLNLQAVAEKALSDNILHIREDVQEPKYLEEQEKYDALLSTRENKEIQYAQEGALVVMEVNTGRVLALVSYPSYDLNLFVNGISKEDYALLLEDPRSPLFNKAISSKGTPGSIFKMVVGLGGLEESVVSLEERITDEGPYNAYVTAGQTGPRCWVRPNYHKHADLNIEGALAVSCNYYFFEVANRLGVDRLTEWSSKLGLTTKTGIELPAEATGQVGNQSVLYDIDKTINSQMTSRPLLVHRAVTNAIFSVGQEIGVSYDETVVNTAAEKMMKYSVQHNQIGPEIRRLLQDDIGIPLAIIRNKNLDKTITDYLGELKWTPNNTIVVGIGQDLTTITPIGVARYLSAIVNGGTVYQASIVKSVVSPDGQVLEEKQPVVVNQLDVHPEYLKAIRDGMKSVVSEEDGGTAAKHFKNWAYTSMIGGKTGSAQVSQIDMESNSWFVAYAPQDNPEIAVVAFIPHGNSGSDSAPAIKGVLEYYLDKKLNTPDSNITPQNTMLP